MLSPGTRLGPYEIVAPAGAGGMGEVYKATDTRLNRTVALKILPRHLSENDEMRQRFEREAQTIAGLNHPHICTLHDVGHQDGVDFLVMEYVEGETLATRLERGPLPITDALRIAIQMGDALDKAHRQGVVHRDFKPGNVMLTRGGTSRPGAPQAKLLDFGLAKLRTSGPVTPVTVTAAPTNAKDLTMVGSVMGTLQYMAPEQIEGKDADARTDIFALGATLYEMLTGQKAFQGKSQVSLIAAILEHEPPPMTALQPIVPASLEEVVRGCLTKDPDERWQSARDVVRQLTWITDHLNDTPGGQPAASTAGRDVSRRERLVWGAITAAALIVAGVLGARVALREEPAPPAVVRFGVSPPADARWSSAVPRFAVSPDGRTLILAATGGGAPGQGESEQFWLRRVDSTDVQPLTGTQLAPGEFQLQSPFWSPDGRTLGYFVGTGAGGMAGIGTSRLKLIPLDGGQAQTITEVLSNNPGATWNESNEILLSSSGTKGVQRIPATGGVAVQVTTLDDARNETAHLWPQFLPDGQHFVYLAQTRERSEWSIWVTSIDSPNDRRMVVKSDHAQFVAPDLVFFTRGNTVLAQRLDVASLTLIGEPVQAVDSVAIVGGNGRAAFAASQTGVLVYAKDRDGTQAGRTLTWYDRNGIPTSTGIRTSGVPLRLSPDDRRVVIAENPITVGTPDLVIYDLERGGLGTRLTTDPGPDRSPVWTADGTRLVFASNRNGTEALYEISSTGATAEQLLIDVGEAFFPLDARADGLLVLSRGTLPRDLWYWSRSGNRDPERYLSTPFDETQATLSPDGTFLAYVSNDGSRSDVIVQPFPDPSGGKWVISTEGGSSPHWRQDGREIFYRDLSNRIVAVPFTPGRPPGAPTALFELPFLGPVGFLGSLYSFDVSGDGKQFLVSAPFETGASAPPLTVTLNWVAPR